MVDVEELDRYMTPLEKAQAEDFLREAFSLLDLSAEEQDELLGGENSSGETVDAFQDRISTEVEKRHNTAFRIKLMKVLVLLASGVPARVVRNCVAFLGARDPDAIAAMMEKLTLDEGMEVAAAMILLMNGPPTKNRHSELPCTCEKCMAKAAKA